MTGAYPFTQHARPGTPLVGRLALQFFSATASICIVVLMLAPATPAHALDPKLQFYQYAFDIPGVDVDIPSEIYDVIQANAGFLWLATARGLLKFDGLEASSYRVAEFPGVLSNKPNRLFIDSRDRLFVASERGLSMYADGVFTIVVQGERWATRISAFAEDDQGNIWLGGELGLRRFDGQQIHTAEYEQDMRRIRSLMWHGNRLYVGSRGELHVVGPDDVVTIALPEAMARARVRDLEYHQGRIWGGTRSGLFRLEGDIAVSAGGAELDDVSIDVLLSDRDDNLWFGSRSVLGRIYPDGRVELPNVEDERFGYAPEMTQLFEDDRGQHWHTSSSFGLTAIRDTPVRRISFTEGLQSTDVTALTTDASGTVYVGTDKGVSSLKDGLIDNFASADFSPGRTIRSLAASDDRILWVGTQRGLRAFDLDSNEWQALPEDEVLSREVNALVTGASNDIWIATDRGLHNLRQGSLRTVPQTDGLDIKSLLLDSSGTLWLGTEAGIAAIINGNLVQYATEHPDFSGPVIAIAELPNGNVIAATSDHGVLMFNGERWLGLNESNGLPAEMLIDVEVRGDDVWMVTGAGVFLASLKELAQVENQVVNVRPIVAAQRHRSVYNTNCCRGRSDEAALIVQGEVMTATDDGVVIFSTDIPTDYGSAPQPYIKSISSSDDATGVYVAEPVIVKPDQNQVRIDYSAIQLTGGTQVEFRHRLLGHSDEWVEVGKTRSAQFQSLPPGDYLFEVQASSGPENWSATKATVAFERQPAFLETAAFRTLIWVATVAAVLFLIWMRMATVRQRHRHLEAQIQERTVALDELNAELKVTNEELKLASQTDPLTGLVNRRYFDTTSTHSELAHSVAGHGILMMIDIDHFKRINDAYGHTAGDEILCQFADVLRSVTRQSDLVARWGGEEFMLVCRCPNDDAAAFLDRVTAAIRERWFKLMDGRELQITCSIGSVRYPLWAKSAHRERLSVTLEIADAALYTVKMNGRDGWALLEGGAQPVEDLQEHEVGSSIKDLVDDRHLLWHASRPEINLAMDDTVTRLRAIKIDSH